MLQALLLDLDGTLIHSEPVAARALMDALARQGRQIRAADADLVVGRTWHSALDLLEARGLVPSGDRERAGLLSEVLAVYREKLRTDVSEVPGAARAIRELSSHFKVAVVSGSFREEIGLALEGLGVAGCVSFYLGAEDYPRSKPAPDGYLAALSRMGLLPGQALVFEDSEAGMASAIAAGIRVVAVRHCRSMADHSPWLARASGVVVDWSQVSAEWVRSLSSADPKVTGE